MRASVIALLSAVSLGAVLGCTPADEERCGDSGKYYWDEDWHACFERGEAPVVDTDTTPISTEPDTDTDTNIGGLGEECSDGPKLNAGGCETKEANFCASFMGTTKICTTLCSDLTGHSDCPPDYYCCDFIVIANTPDHCIPSEWWAQLKSPSTCANWTK